MSILSIVSTSLGRICWEIHQVTVGQFRRFVEESRHQTEAEKAGTGSPGWDDRRRAREARSREELAKSRFLPNGRPSGGVRQSQRCRGFLRVAEHDGEEGGADVSLAQGRPSGTSISGQAVSNALFVISTTASRSPTWPTRG